MVAQALIQRCPECGAIRYAHVLAAGEPLTPPVEGGTCEVVPVEVVQTGRLSHLSTCTRRKQDLAEQASLW